jgi:hypothetical protein
MRFASRMTLLSLIVFAALASGASAGTYTVYSCRTPAGNPAPISGWDPTIGGPFIFAVNTCASGGGFGISMDPTTGHAKGTYGLYTFTAPPDTSLDSYSLWRNGSSGLPGQPSFSYDLISYEGKLQYSAPYVRDNCVGNHGCSSVGGSAEKISDPNKYSGGPFDDYTQLFVEALCNGTFSADCPATGAGTASADYSVWRADINLRDDSDPTFTTPPIGDLLDNSKPMTGQKFADFSASDKGGGLYQAVVEIDGQRVATAPVDTNDGKCVKPFTVTVPCRSTANGSITFDTSQVNDGPHQMRLLVTDATDTNAAIYGPISIVTANGKGGAAPGTKLTAGVRVGKHLRSSATVRFSTRPLIRGRLKAPGGTPIANASIQVVSKFARPGAGFTLAGTVKTDAKGYFSTRLRAGAQSRTVRFAYPAYSKITPYAGDDVTIRVRTAASLKVTPRRTRNGATVTFSGRLAGRPVPAGGKLVSLQAFARGRWITFAQPHARGKSAAFKARYRFTKTFRTTLYRFRAVVAKESGYAFEAGRSRTVSVLVRG